MGGSLAQQDAQGFVDGLAADGWLVNFNWGEANAWESDWRRNDDIWVDEGAKLTTYAKQGTPLLSAWLRTGQETQPSTNGAGAPDGPTVWVGGMWVARNGADPSGDHLWGHGSVSADPTSPTTLAAMWTTC
ncbi:DUF6345 domain-containing protein [Nonomuraea sp. NPDC050536]|uniref:DUF6345 domain-containing protein n=1 Tax=Nonomuraea sp. NPDC050536 TaxID=3364366 RepID=UPI0037CB3B70